MKLSAIHIYPVKGCAGIEVSGVRLDERGPLLDRRFMIVDDAGNFLSQRTLPRMAVIQPKLTPTQLVLEAPGMQKLSLAQRSPGAARKRVTVWGDEVQAESMGRNAADWLSELLGQTCELVRLADDAVRLADARYTSHAAPVGFADAFPLLLISEASLSALNARLPTPVPMNRFRPNLVVSGTQAHAEDGWKQIRVGELILDVVKACARCTVPTVDQRTGQVGKEPMATLARYRNRQHKVYFGQNCVHRDRGMLRVGDEVSVLETCEAPPFDT